VGGAARLGYVGDAAFQKIWGIRLDETVSELDLYAQTRELAYQLDGTPRFRWTDTGAVLANQGRMHAQVHGIAQADRQYTGLLGWCAFDYASLNGGDRIWASLKTPGVLDTFRVPIWGCRRRIRPVAARPDGAGHGHGAAPAARARLRPAHGHSGLGPCVPVSGSTTAQGILEDLWRVREKPDRQAQRRTRRYADGVRGFLVRRAVR
jgi:hypothetical protein